MSDASASSSRQVMPPYSHMITVFHPPTQTEAAVFASLIEATREQTLAFTLEILLAVTPSGPQEIVQSPSLDFVEPDRRETLRIPLSLPARLETMRRQEPGTRLQAQVMDLSRTGACLLVKEHPEASTTIASPFTLLRLIETVSFVPMTLVPRIPRSPQRSSGQSQTQRL